MAGSRVVLAEHTYRLNAISDDNVLSKAEVRVDGGWYLISQSVMNPVPGRTVTKPDVSCFQSFQIYRPIPPHCSLPPHFLHVVLPMSPPKDFPQEGHLQLRAEKPINAAIAAICAPKSAPLEKFA